MCGRLKREERLEAAAMLHLQSGRVKDYCELQVGPPYLIIAVGLSRGSRGCDCVCRWSWGSGRRPLPSPPP